MILGGTNQLMESGGSLNLEGGRGINESPYDGGDGGAINIFGGSSSGKSWKDLGGNITISGKYFFLYLKNILP